MEKHATTLTYNGASGPLLAGASAKLGGVLTDAEAPVAGSAVTFVLGTGASAQSCTATTDTSGQASCTTAGVNQPLGPGTVSGTFAGDGLYLSSSDSKATLVFAFPSGGGSLVVVTGVRAAR